jgi:ABC-2 type transport system permease protein
MIRAINSEIMKLRTTKTWWLIGLFALLFTGLGLLINCLSGHFELHPPSGQGPPDQPADQRSEFDAKQQAQAQSAATLLRVAANLYTSGQLIGVLLIMLLGVLIVTNEFHHQTATTTFLTIPHRTTVIVAKLVAGILFAFGFWLVTTAINLVVGALFLQNQGRSTAIGEWVITRSILLNLAAYSVWAVLGISLGVLIRSQIGAVVTATLLYLGGFLGAILIFNLVHEYLIKKDWVLTAQVIVPSIASQIMTTSGPTFDHAPPQWVGAVVLIGYGVVFGVIGTLITRKRDIS